MSNYSTITKDSVLRAIGPFRETFTYQAPGNQITQGQTQIISHSFFVQRTQEAQGFDIPSPINAIVQQELLDSAYATMLASEAILAREWDTPEEDAAWADL